LLLSSLHQLRSRAAHGPRALEGPDLYPHQPCASRRDDRALCQDAESDYDYIQGGIARDGTVPATVQSEKIALRSEMVDVPPAQQMKAAAIFDFGPARKALADLNAKGWKPTP
jgi:hypothetical protein